MTTPWQVSANFLEGGKSITASTKAIDLSILLLSTTCTANLSRLYSKSLVDMSALPVLSLSCTDLPHSSVSQSFLS